MTTEQLRPSPSLRLPGAGRALVVTVVLGLAACGLAVVVGGGPQVAGALAGTVLVAAFFLFGMVNTALGAAFAPQASLVVALLTYTAQVVALALVLVAVSRSGASPEHLDVRWLAGTVIAGALGWTVALVVDALRVTSEEVVRG
jgi:ATP synthase protein I